MIDVESIVSIESDLRSIAKPKFLSKLATEERNCLSEPFLNLSLDKAIAVFVQQFHIVTEGAFVKFIPELLHIDIGFFLFGFLY